MYILYTIIAVYLFSFLIRGIRTEASPLISIGLKYGYQLTINYKEVNCNYILPLDIVSQASWIISKTNDADVVAVCKIVKEPIAITYTDKNYVGKELSAKIVFDGDQGAALDEFFYQFYPNAPQIYSRYLGGIGLGYNFKDERFSIVHQFKQKGLINQLAFSIVEKKPKSILYLGGIPEDVSSLYHSSCDVIGLYNFWDCYMTQITLKASNGLKYLYDCNTTDVSSYMHFDSMNLSIYAPPNFLKQIQRTYLRREFRAKKCLYLMMSNENIITCAYNPDYLNGNISFVIGEYNYEFSLNAFWNCDMDYCDFLIAENPKGNSWVFGKSFLMKHNVMFDYERSKVHFYSEGGVKPYNKQEEDRINQNGVIGLFLTVIVLVCLGCAFVFVIKIIEHRTK